MEELQAEIARLEKENEKLKQLICGYEESLRAFLEFYDENRAGIFSATQQKPSDKEQSKNIKELLKKHSNLK